MQFFRLLKNGFANTRKSVCSAEARGKFFDVCLECNISSFSIKYYKTLVVEYKAIQNSNASSDRDIQLAAKQLGSLAAIIRHICNFESRQKLELVYNEYWKFLIDSLNSSLAFEVIGSLYHKSGFYILFLHFLSILLNFVRRLGYSRSKLHADLFPAIMRYTEISNDEALRGTCYAILSYMILPEDEPAIPEIEPATRTAIKFHRKGKTVEELLTLADQVLDRFDSASADVLVNHPWRYHNDYQ